MNAKTANFFAGPKLDVRLYASYLYLNELIGYVDLSDFHGNWQECSSDINLLKACEAFTKFEVFLS